LAGLTALFQKLGAPDPEGWATSQIEEGIAQLPRFLFLRQAWSKVVSESDPSWIDASLQFSEKTPDAPFAGVGKAIASLRAKGATDQELTDLVRGMQVELLFGLCYLIADPDLQEEEVRDIAWSLVTVDEGGEPKECIQSLHESVLELDPTGRAMRPRK
jgi:hypothetical protein